MEIIPHRDPMLLIDEVSELVPGDHIVATFWVDPQREIFKGHFPGDTLEIHAEMLTERADKAIATCKCTVYTAGDLAAESEVTIAMR